MRVDRCLRVKEVELWHHGAEVEIRLKEGADGSDVLPVTLERVALHMMSLDGCWNDVLAEVHEVVVQCLHEHIAAEHVDAHVRLELRFIRRGGRALRVFPQAWPVP